MARARAVVKRRQVTKMPVGPVPDIDEVRRKQDDEEENDGSRGKHSKQSERQSASANDTKRQTRVQRESAND